MNSTTHTAHPDSHEHGLADDCPRCAEHAERPVESLDARNLARLTRLATDRDRFARGASETDLIAAAKILTALERTGQLFEVAGLTVTAYLREQWRIPVAMTEEIEGGEWVA